MLEVGLSILQKDGSFVNRHIKISENSRMINRYCKTSALGFVFGTTELKSTDEVRRLLLDLVSNGGNGACFMWHNGIHDKRVLRNIGIDVDAMGIKCYDTGEMFQEINKERQKRTLEHLCRTLDVDYLASAFHNAGNDAVYTMRSYLKMI